MEYDLYKKLIDFASKHAALINFSFFGEPMLHPEFLRFMDYLKNRPSTLSVVMNTNLTLATKEVFENLIEIKLD